VKLFIDVPELPGARRERKFNMNKPDIKQYLVRPFSVLAMVFASPSARGVRPTAARGAFFSCRCILDVSKVGNITIVTSSITIALTGMLSGTLVATEVDVFYPNGNLLVSISGTFSGTVAGQSGTAEISGTGGPITGRNGTGVLNWMIGQGTLGLAGLHGHGSFQHPIFGPAIEQCSGDMVIGDYSGRLQLGD
jgi:hypothetical protein